MCTGVFRLGLEPSSQLAAAVLVVVVVVNYTDTVVSYVIRCQVLCNSQTIFHQNKPNITCVNNQYYEAVIV
jgi:hypothetical protein